VNNYKDLIVWKKAVDFTVLIYKETATFPKSEIYGLSSQLQRASNSIAANIADGAGRNSDKEFVHFLSIALGSLYETETHLTVCQKIGSFSSERLEYFSGLIFELDKMLKALQKSKNKSE
jgi:four helix bundle protein